MAQYAEANGLKRMGARPALSTYIKDAFSRRDFAFALSSFSNDAANARNRLGSWWMVILPTLQAATYGLIFGVILGSNRPDNFLAFLFTGVFLFQFFSGSFSTGATAITQNVGLVKSLSFPRALLPVSAVIRQFLNLLPQLAVLLVMLLILQRTISWSWLALIPIVFLMLIFASGLAMIAARMTVQVRDLTKVIPFITRIAFYVSGIFFSMEHILANYPYIWAVAKWNPVYDFIELARGALVVGHTMSVELWVACAVWSVATLAIGTVYFWKAEERYGRD